MNNFKNNNRRGRYKPTGDRGFRRNGSGHKPNGEFNNGSSFKRKYPEKYNDRAREALSNGDKILSENYLQHSEHFSRILTSQENSRSHNENASDANTSSQLKVEDQNKDLETTT